MGQLDETEAKVNHPSGHRRGRGKGEQVQDGKKAVHTQQVTFLTQWVLASRGNLGSCG